MKTHVSGKSDQVERLVVLPFKKALEISLKSLQARFYRSLITTLSLLLAVSFLSFVRVETDVANGMLATGDPTVRQKLINSGYDIPDEAQSMESSPKQRWIVMLSLLVCAVGIVNAQLMAVTERFREIGTMKCLGALDRFILRLFLLESGMQGLVGATAGALAGALFAVLNGLMQFGSTAIASLSLTDLLVTVGLSIGVGFLLSLIGVLYPAIVAARMQPVEAMRVEQ